LILGRGWILPGTSTAQIFVGGSKHGYGDGRGVGQLEYLW
jgi:hypothetical protein